MRIDDNDIGENGIVGHSALVERAIKDGLAGTHAPVVVTSESGKRLQSVNILRLAIRNRNNCD